VLAVKPGIYCSAGLSLSPRGDAVFGVRRVGGDVVDAGQVACAFGTR
jgi:hypothetical protein